MSHPLFYGNKARKAQYSYDNLTELLNRLIREGYNYDIVVRPLGMAYFGINMDPLIGSLHRN